MSQRDYDVIIIGGRCAGSTLAIRLARQKLKVLVIDRATFPSQPAVTSSPVFHNGHMQLLDELDISEAEYSLPGSRVDQYVIDFRETFLFQTQQNYSGNKQVLSTPFLFYFGLRPEKTALDTLIKYYGPKGAFPAAE